MCRGTQMAETELKRHRVDEVETQIERRRSPRAPVVVRVSYSTVDSLFSDFTRNINEGGMFIETDNPVPLDTVVNVQFQLPGRHDPIRASGRVVRVGGDLGEPNGMAIEFEELDPEACQRINELVRKLRSP